MFLQNLVSLALKWTHHYLFIHASNVNIFIFIYGDDMFVIGTRAHLIQEVILTLQKIIPVKNLSPLAFFLSIQASRDFSGIYPCQAKYIIDVLTRAEMIGTKPYLVPCIAALNYPDLLV